MCRLLVCLFAGLRGVLLFLAFCWDMAIEPASGRFRYSSTTEEFVEVSRLYPNNGLLLLEGDADEWILSANSADCLKVLTLELYLRNWRGPKIQCVSKLPSLQRLLLRHCGELPANLGDLGSLTHLSLDRCLNIESLPDSIGDLSYLTTLRINHCDSLRELPANLGDLGSLTHLSLEWCSSIKSLPDSIARLSKLTALSLKHCESLEELPADLVELSNLSLFNVQFTPIKWLPANIAKLSNLSLLLLPKDFRLHSLMPSHFNDSLLISVEDNFHVRKTWGEFKTEIDRYRTHVRFEYSKTTKQKTQVYRLYPDGSLLLMDTDPDEWILSNPAHCLSVLSLELNLKNSRVEKIDCVSKLRYLQRLLFCDGRNLQELPENLGDLGSLTYLSLQWCSNIKYLPSSIGKLSNLTALHLNQCYSLKELPATLGELPKLCLLNIQFSPIKWLPWSIAKLSKLTLLLLPSHFRLETLPTHLNNSLVISVDDHHVRKTWAELKAEIGVFSVPVVREAARFPSTPGYLSYQGDPRPCIQEKGLYSLVRVLDLNLRTFKCKESIPDSIVDLPILTHLYISWGCLSHLPITLTKITHLSLFSCKFRCHIEACFDSLGKLSTLQSLELLACEDLLARIDLSFSLTHLTLQPYEKQPLADSIVASIRQLSDLKSLALIAYDNVDLSLLNVNLVKLKLWDCSIKSLPPGLWHLEIIHSSSEICLLINSRSFFFKGEALKKEKKKKMSSSCDELLSCLNNFVNLETLSVTCRHIQSFPSIEGLLSLQQLHLKDCFSLSKFPPNMDKLVNLLSINVSGTRIKSLSDSFTSLHNLEHLILPKCFAFESLSQNFKEKIMVIEDNTDDLYYEHEGYCSLRYDSNEDNEFTLCSTENDGVVLQESEHEIINKHTSLDRPMNSIPNAKQVQEGCHFSDRIDQIDNVVSSSVYHEKEILPAEKEVCVVPVVLDNHSNFHEPYGHHIPNNISQQVHAHPNGFGVSENPQVQPMVMFSSRATNQNSSLQEEETTFDESNVETSKNRQMDNMEIEHGIASADSENPVHDRSDEHALEHKRKKTHKIDIPRERLEELKSQGMTTEEAAIKLGVGRATVVRTLKEKGMSWPRPKKRKQQDDTNTVDPANDAGNVVQTSTSNATRRTVEEPSLETQSQVDGQQMEEHSNGANECARSNTDAQTDESPGTFVVIATVKNDSVKFDFSLRCSIEQLKAEVGKRLELKVRKFKIKYVDVAGKLLLMADASDLKHAFDIALFSNSYGKRVIQLSITK